MTLLTNRISPLIFCILLFLSCSDQPADNSESKPLTPSIGDLPVFKNPPILTSQNGIWEYTLTAGPAVINVAGKTFESNVYNELYIPPVIKVKRGDDIRLTLRNQLKNTGGDAGSLEDSLAITICKTYSPLETNLHYHGMAISPLAPADNIYMFINANNDFEYHWQVPVDHPQGLHWYHPHRCGLVEDQLLGGLSGFLIIDGLLEEQYPEISNIEERMLLLKDIVLPGTPDSLPKTKTINGLAKQQIPIKPGEWQMWSVGNIGADSFFKLKVDGHKFWVLAEDGNPLEQPQEASELFLAPSARTTVLIQGGNRGQYNIRSMEVDTGPQGDPNPEIELGRLVVAGDQIDGSIIAERIKKPAADPSDLGGSTDEVEALPITRKRTITFSESADGGTFFIDGKTFEEDRNDIEVNLGDVEEWTIVNESEELHVFHIHQLDFLVTEIQGQTKDMEGLRDVIDIPFKQNGKPGVVMMANLVVKK